MQEIRLQRKLRECANVLDLYKVFESKSFIYLLMEYKKGGTLGDLLEREVKFTEEDSRVVAA